MIWHLRGNEIYIPEIAAPMSMKLERMMEGIMVMETSRLEFLKVVRCNDRIEMKCKHSCKSVKKYRNN